MVIPSSLYSSFSLLFLFFIFIFYFLFFINFYFFLYFYFLFFLFFYIFLFSDKTISPPGKHVALLFCQYTPYEHDWNVKKKNKKNLKYFLFGEKKKEKSRKEYANTVFSTIDEYIPNFSKSIVGYDMLSKYFILFFY